MTKNLWVISDTHFGHENIIKYCDRPFKDSKEMDECIVSNWNEIVKPGDKVYHLGDVYMGQRTKKTDDYWNWFFARLNGQKRLILGNHDDGKDPNLHAHFRKINIWRMFRDLGLLLTHVPVHPLTLGENDRQDQPRRLKNIHGHIHQNNAYSPMYVNVCVEKTGYKPVNLEELKL